MTSYKHNVQCRSGNALPIGNCKRMIDTMMTSTVRKTFGKEGDPFAYVKLPKHLYESQLLDR